MFAAHAAQTANSISSALEALRREIFDLLICDIGLPDGTGFDLLAKVREFCDIPALALSGFGTQEDVARSKAAGFGEHLTKPVNFQKLDIAISQLTATRRAFFACNRVVCGGNQQPSPERIHVPACSCRFPRTLSRREPRGVLA